jgi:hypothetical protein
MWLAMKALMLRWLLARSVGGLLSLLFVVALPLAGVLKVVGIPLLIVLAIVGLPMLLVLAVIGLPILLVVGTVSLLMTAVGGILAAGLVMLKVALPIVLVVWLATWLFKKVRRRGDATPPSSTGPATPATPEGFDPTI